MAADRPHPAGLAYDNDRSGLQKQASLLPVIEGFKNLIEGDPALYIRLHPMFDQVPTKPP